jgi:3-hydroxybutyryl-CoA dehydratase
MIRRHTETFDADDTYSFASLTGDHNDLHLDHEAAQAVFDDCVVHGMLVASTISAALAKLPGSVVLLEQQLSYNEPTYYGDEVTATVVNLREDDDGNEVYTTQVRGPQGLHVYGTATVSRAEQDNANE